MNKTKHFQTFIILNKQVTACFYICSKKISSVRKLLQLFKTKFSQILAYGLSPFQLAITLSFGITLGLFPFIGLTSILCFVFAFVFRLNLIVIQLVNWVVAPLQLVLLVPFYQIGNYFNSYFSNASLVTNTATVNVIGSNFFQKILLLIDSQILAILGWAVICVPFALSIHFISLFFYKKYLHKKSKMAA